MTNNVIASTAGQWKLTGIEATSGQCECCSRRLTQRVFTVAHPVHGIAALGRRCAAKATGYAASAIERELARALRSVEVDRRRVIVAAAYPIFAQQQADLLAWAAMSNDERMASTRTEHEMGRGYMRLFELFQNATLTDCWWGGRGWADCDTWAEYIDSCLARA